MTGLAIIQLQPKRQPGRTDRKAAAYAAEILRLRVEGYTFEAIREALADVGIELSTSALWREVDRQRRRAEAMHRSRPSALRQATSTPSPSASPVRKQPPPAGANGREIAEAFFSTNLSNPLLRGKDAP